MPHLHHGAVVSRLSLFFTLVLVLTALVYLRGWLSLRSSCVEQSSVWRAVSFMLGLFFIWAALASPIAALDHELLTVHMLQHLLLMTLAPPLIWLAVPAGPLWRGLPQRLVVSLAPFRQSRLAKRLASLSGTPEFAWLAACTALVGWHIPRFFALGMQSAPWHLFEQLSFLVTGLLFWWPVVQAFVQLPADASRQDLSMIVYLFFATLPCDLLSGFLVFSDRVVYPMYLSSPRLLGFSALVDQQCAAALMWTCVTIVYFVVGAILTMRLLSFQSRSEADSVQQQLGETEVVRRVSQSMVSQSLVSQSLVSQSLVSQSLVSQSLVSQSLGTL
jgi:putative membrane protein